MNLIKLVPLRTLFWYEKNLLDSYKKTLSFLKKNKCKLLHDISEIKLKNALSRGLKTPAYVSFLKKNKKFPAKNKINANYVIDNVPIMDKKNYIKKYSYEKRCIDGKLPIIGNIDESSGSSGTPTNWIRSYNEESFLIKAANFEYNYAFNTKQNKQTIVISAWSVGPWATGIKFSEMVEHFSLVKSTGTDIKDIIRTLETFGKKYHYIIAGYPFFLQTLLEKKFPWKEYDIDLLTGGDGYSALWPKKIKKYMKSNSKIVSSYGCSDIDVGIGFETPLTQSIREELIMNKNLMEELFGETQTIPMVFQYNPTLHYVHNLPNGEFAITHLDPYVVSPKIKYNIHDLGGNIKFKDMLDALEKYAPKVYEKANCRSNNLNVINLPFLYIVGRSDGTVSFDGANVFPEQLEIIFAKHFSDIVRNFKIIKKENLKNSFHILIELHKGKKVSIALRKQLERILKNDLPIINDDYKESLENNSTLIPVIKLYGVGTGPFSLSKNKIKFKVVENIKKK